MEKIIAWKGERCPVIGEREEREHFVLVPLRYRSKARLHLAFREEKRRSKFGFREGEKD